MRPGGWLGLASLACALALAGAAEAKIPSAALSEVDPCLIACPAGDSLFRVITRDASFNPLPLCSTWVRLCGCPTVHVAPGGGGASYDLIDGCVVARLTDYNGIADFYIRGGGVCSGATIEVVGNYVRLATLTAVASPDQNGDLVVDAADLAIVESKLGASDPTADLDCDGSVTAADLAIAQGHLGHMAPPAVGVQDGDSRVAMLRQNRPNPFSGTSRIAFRLRWPEAVTLKVFDVHGREVVVLLEGVRLGPGSHEVLLDGRGLATGIYVYRLEAGTSTATRRMAVFH